MYNPNWEIKRSKTLWCPDVVLSIFLIPAPLSFIGLSYNRFQSLLTVKNFSIFCVNVGNNDLKFKSLIIIHHTNSLFLLLITLLIWAANVDLYIQPFYNFKDCTFVLSSITLTRKITITIRNFRMQIKSYGNYFYDTIVSLRSEINNRL